jgi:hypothetical protein
VTQPTDLYEIFVGMKNIEQEELVTYDTDFTAYDSIPVEITDWPCTVRFPIRGEFADEGRQTIDGSREEDSDEVGVFLIIAERSNSITNLVTEAAKWKNRLRDAYKKHRLFSGEAVQVSGVKVLSYVFDTITIGNTVYFGLNFIVKVTYWRTSTVGD